jgi:hypothetical protein
MIFYSPINLNAPSIKNASADENSDLIKVSASSQFLMALLNSLFKRKFSFSYSLADFLNRFFTMR